MQLRILEAIQDAARWSFELENLCLVDDCSKSAYDKASAQLVSKNEASKLMHGRS